MYRTAARFFAFSLTVLRSFKRNQGMLLSGAAAFYTLLSLIPMLILAIIALSHLVEEGPLFDTISRYTEMVIPGYTKVLTEQVHSFLMHRNVIGIIGFLFMLFFSSMAFTVLENAMSVIFAHRVKTRKRRFLVSAIIPYIYIVLIVIGILLTSSLAGVLEVLENKKLMVLGWSLSLEEAPGIILYLLGLVSEVFMITSLYMVMPLDRTKFRHAFTGGVVATILWEISRRILFWYYSTLSMINLIYGSFATAIVALLNIEAATIILLLGAQVIAELELKTQTDKQDE